MQNKYLSALKTKYASFGLSKEALDRVALQRVKTIANEEEIDSDIATTDTMLLIMKEIQGSADSQRTRASQIQKELDDLKKSIPSNEPIQSEPDNALAAEIQALKAIVTGFQAEAEAGRKKAQADAILAEVHEKMKTKGCTNDYIRTNVLSEVKVGESDTADSIAERYLSVYDDHCKKVFGAGYVPPKGNNVNEGGDVNYAAMVEGLKHSGALPK